MDGLKTKNLLEVNEDKYLSVFGLMDEALSLLSSRNVEFLDRLIKLGRKIVRKTPLLVHAYLILAIAYYKKKEYDKAYEFGDKGLKFHWHFAIIPSLEFFHLNYENHFHFVRTVREIHEKEDQKIHTGGLFVMAEHYRQQETLHFMEMIIE